MASEYGWAKREILEHVYFDELMPLSRQITRRRLSEQKMALAIATNPHVKEPQRLWSAIEEQENQLDGKSYLDAEFDAAGFEAFKSTIQRNSRSLIVK